MKKLIAPCLLALTVVFFTSGCLVINVERSDKSDKKTESSSQQKTSTVQEPHH